MYYYATADKTELVAEDDPRATFVINDNDPGEFAALVKAEKERQAKEPEPTPVPASASRTRGNT